jgi:hypothetical protein
MLCFKFLSPALPIDAVFDPQQDRFETLTRQQRPDAGTMTTCSAFRFLGELKGARQGTRMASGASPLGDRTE